MKIATRDEHLLRLLFLGVVLTLLYLAILVPLGFLESSRLRSGDTYSRWRNGLFAPPAQLEDLLLVTIDEESQRRMEKKWPWDRGVFASFLQRIGQGSPRVVLFDLVFSGSSDPAQDAELAEAIRNGPPVLLAAYLDDRGNPVLPLPALTEAGGIPGLINKPRDADHAVRRLWAGAHLPGQEEPLYAIEVKAACLALGIPLGEIQTKPDELRMGARRVPIDRPGTMSINPFLSSADRIPTTVPFWKALQGGIPPEEIRGKIVLLGTSSEITHDVYPTALGVMPGVMISANGILTLLAEDYLRPVPPALALIGGGALLMAVLFLTFRLPLAWGAVAASVIAALAVAAGFLLHLLLGWRADPLSLVLLAGAPWIAGTFYRHGLLLFESVRLHRQVIQDPVSGAVSARYFLLRTRQAAALHARRRKPLSFCAVRMEKPSDLMQRISPEEVRKSMRNLVETLDKSKPAGGIVGRLAEDCFGVLLPGMEPEKALEWADRVKRALGSGQGPLDVGISSTAKGSLRAEDLIQTAQEAARPKSAIAVKPVAGAAPNLAPPEQKIIGEPGGVLDFVASELEERNSALERALGDLKVAHREMEQHFLEVTKSLVAALETKDPYTAGHLERVSRYATRLAEILNLSPEDVASIREAALLHDIGKIGIPDEVLHKVGILSADEVALIRQHLSIGAKILEPMKFFRPITTIIYHHHERFDGKGYPHGLTGEFIPPGAQVITIADSFDAMTTSRSYNKPKTAQEALDEMRKGSGSQFNPHFVDAFVELMLREGPHLAGHQGPV